MSRKVRIGITIGDPSGIGPEVIVKSLRRIKQIKDYDIVLFGDHIALAKNGLRGSKDKFILIDLQAIRSSEFRFGKLCKKFGMASLMYLKESIKLLKEGQID